MRIKRVLQGTALTALAAAAWIGAGTVDAAAEEFPSANIKVDTAAQKMTVKTDDKEVVVGIGTRAKNKNSVKVSAWDVYDTTDIKYDNEDANGTVVDLSKLSNTKDNYLVVKTEQADPIYIKIAASVKKQKAKFTAGDCKLDFTGSDENPSGQYQYRTSYGDWQTLDLSKNEKNLFEEYLDQGASLYVRAAAATKAAIAADTTDKVFDASIKEKDVQESDKKTVYNAGSFPGKEVKVNIAKRANGPSISADYANGTVKCNKEVEVRVLREGTNGYTVIKDTALVKQDMKTALNISEYLGDAARAVLEARVKASTDGKKAASRWTRVVLVKTADIVATDAAQTVSGTSVTLTNGVTAKTIVDKRGKITVEIKSTTGSAINVVIKNGTTVASTDRPKVLKNGGTLKISATAEDNILFAMAGDKKTTTWAGGYASMGKVSK